VRWQITSDHGRDRFAEFRQTILGMIATYKYEQVRAAQRLDPWIRPAAAPRPLARAAPRAPFSHAHPAAALSLPPAAAQAIYRAAGTLKMDDVFALTKLKRRHRSAAFPRDRVHGPDPRDTAASASALAEDGEEQSEEEIAARVAAR
jgi:hypothetical protein